MTEGNGEGTLEQKLQHVHIQLVEDLWTAWKNHRTTSSIEAERYSRISVVSLTQVAAMTAVDAGMTEEQYMLVCMANFKEAYNRAPKWG